MLGGKDAGAPNGEEENLAGGEAAGQLSGRGGGAPKGDTERFSSDGAGSEAGWDGGKPNKELPTGEASCVVLGV